MTAHLRRFCNQPSNIREMITQERARVMNKSLSNAIYHLNRKLCKELNMEVVDVEVPRYKVPPKQRTDTQLMVWDLKTC